MQHNLLFLTAFLFYCLTLTLLHIYLNRTTTTTAQTSRNKLNKIISVKNQREKQNLKNQINQKNILDKKQEIQSTSFTPKLNNYFKVKYNKTKAIPTTAENRKKQHKDNNNNNNNNGDKNVIVNSPLNQSGNFHNLSGIFIFSAFLDQRIPSDSLVRLITLQEKNDDRQLLCWFNRGSYLFASYADKYRMCENHGRRFEGRLYSCHAPKWLRAPKVVFVSLGTKNSINTTNLLRFDLISLNQKSKTETFGICIPPLFGSIPMTKLVQFLELAQILGASHFHFYLENVSSSVELILNYYAKLNLVSTMPWKLPSVVVGDSVWYHGQLLAIQDCLYRNMASFKYLVFLDLDELIIPRHAYNWTDMIASIKNTTENVSQAIGFSFKSSYFDPWQSPEPSSQQLSYFQLLERTKAISHVHTKVMIEADKVFEMGIHHLSKAILENLRVIQVKPEVAILHHYRTCVTKYEATMQCNPKIRDTTILKYSNQLQNRYSYKIKELLKQFL